MRGKSPGELEEQTCQRTSGLAGDERLANARCYSYTMPRHLMRKSCLGSHSPWLCAVSPGVRQTFLRSKFSPCDLVIRASDNEWLEIARQFALYTSHVPRRHLYGRLTKNRNLVRFVASLARSSLTRSPRARLTPLRFLGEWSCRNLPD